jgi:hypothetical protein
MIISREQAICLLFCEEVSEANISMLTKRIGSMEGIEICYETDPLQPRLIPSTFLQTHQSRFRKYAISSKLCTTKVNNSGH